MHVGPFHDLFHDFYHVMTQFAICHGMIKNKLPKKGKKIMSSIPCIL